MNREAGEEPNREGAEEPRRASLRLCCSPPERPTTTTASGSPCQFHRAAQGETPRVVDNAHVRASASTVHREKTFEMKKSPLKGGLHAAFGAHRNPALFSFVRIASSGLLGMARR
jgi:hypothetical protein